MKTIGVGLIVVW